VVQTGRRGVNDSVNCSLTLRCSLDDEQTQSPWSATAVTGDWIGTFTGHKEPSGLAAWNQSGSLAATASGDFQCPRFGDGITGESRSISFLQNILSGRMATFSRIRDIVRVDTKEFCASLIADSLKAPMEIAGSSEKIMISKVNWLSDTVLLAGCSDGNWFASGILVHRVPKAPTHTIKVTDGTKEIRDMEV
jgi:hypothetical protein